jgi:cytochrome c-type biogenesis protein CcmH/NrfG
MGDDGLSNEIAKLAKLHAEGTLTAEEFAAAKAKLVQTEDSDGEVRLPTAGQIVRLGVGVALRTFLLVYVALPLVVVFLVLVIVNILE